MKKTRKKKGTNGKTRKTEIVLKKTKNENFGNSYRCVPATENNKDKGKLVTITGDLMVITKEKTTFN